MGARGIRAGCKHRARHGCDLRELPWHGRPQRGHAGVDKAHIVAQMQDFKSGKRPSTIMQQLAKGFSDAQIEQIAAYFAAQKK